MRLKLNDLSNLTITQQTESWSDTWSHMTNSKIHTQAAMLIFEKQSEEIKSNN